MAWAARAASRARQVSSVDETAVAHGHRCMTCEVEQATAAYTEHGRKPPRFIH
jgi:hypothetical protein